MNIQETAAVLAKIKIGDNREVDSQGLVLREWHDAIGHLEFADAIEAVALHRRESTEYLQPGHVVANVRRVRAARERAERVAAPRQVEAPKITLDREWFEKETVRWIEFYREQKAGK